MKKVNLVFAIIVLFATVFTVNVKASEDQKIKENTNKIESYQEYKDMLSSLPDDVAELLPKELYSDDINDIAKGTEKISSFGFIVETTLELFGLEISKTVKLFLMLLTVIIFSSVMNALKTSFSSSKVSDMFSLCTLCAVFLSCCSYQYSIAIAVKNFFSRICVFANSMIPLMGAMYAMGGNVSSAVVSNASLMLFFNIVENVCAKTVIPAIGICMAFSAVGILVPDISFGGLSGTFKKFYTNFLAFIMTIFTAVMATQSIIANKADTFASRGIKFALGNLIPVVGSALAGTIGTVSTSIEYLRASVGSLGIILVILMLLPTVITLLTAKFALSVSSALAEVMDCGREKRLIDEMSSINSFLLAAGCICSVSLIFMLFMFVKCSSALGVGI